MLRLMCGVLSATRFNGHILLRDHYLTLIHNTHSHAIFGQSVQLEQNICLFFSKALQQLKLQTYFQHLLYMWIQTTQWTKMQVPPSLQREIRIVELLLYLPSCKMVQVLSDAWDHLKNCTNTNSIQSFHLHIHVTVKLSM